MWKQENKSKLTHAIFLTWGCGMWGRRWGVTPLTKAGSASCLIPTLSVLFIFGQQWQKNRNALSWCPCRLQKRVTWTFSVWEKRCVQQYQMSRDGGSVAEVSWTRASLAPRARGNACAELKDEREISSLDCHRKGWLWAPEETDAPTHEDERQDTELTYGTDYFPRLCICFTEL